MKITKTFAVTLGLGTFVAVALAAEPAHAWFVRPHFAAGYGYGLGNHFTGSPRSMYACNACHIGSENFPPDQRIALQVTTARVNGAALENYDLFADGYVPGTTYKIMVEMTGEHRGHYDGNAYEGPDGAFWKQDCPSTDPAGDFFNSIQNRNHMTAEVMNEDSVYADYDGNAAGRLRPDATGGPTAEGVCSSCTGGEAELPQGQESGGPTSVMVRRWQLTDPTAGDFGGWSCGTCDALVTNMVEMPAPMSEAGFSPMRFEYFWRAPDTAPATEGGRIRFYMAGIDGDGYGDTLDDDFAEVRVAVCPAGSAPAECDPVVGPGWGLGLVATGPAASPTARATPVRASSDGAIRWLPTTAAAIFTMFVVFGLRRRWELVHDIGSG